MSAQSWRSSISLLWPEGCERSQARHPAWDDATIADLGLHELARALSPEGRHEERVRQILFAPCDDPNVIAYRQDLLRDLLENEALAEALGALLPSLAQLSFYAAGNPTHPNETALQQVAFRLGELELYVECVQRMRAILLAHANRLASQGLQRLLAALTEVERDAAFQALRAELPDLLARVRNIGSVTVGINLDAHLQPSEATLLSINAHRFKGAGPSLLSKLFGNTDASDGAATGLARLHRIALPDEATHVRDGSARAMLRLVPLFRDLSEILEAVARPVADALLRYARLNGQLLITLESEIAFYLGAIRLIRRIEAAGLPMCRPTICPADERAGQMHDLFNLNLALRMLAREPGARLDAKIVLNDAAFDDTGRIFILTGPNQGGKTTYIQAIGLIHVLAQAGLHVPSRRARLSPVDAIFTHFAAEERPDLESGRLGEEARRLSAIFSRATRCSLILLNESLSSTSPGESLYLARDVVRGLRALGARAIFATHLHSLAEEADQINAGTAGDSRVASLVSETVPAIEGSDEAGQRTFRIVRGPPMGMSYARDIARKYGISFEQLQDKINRAHVPSPRPAAGIPS